MPCGTSLQTKKCQRKAVDCVYLPAELSKGIYPNRWRIDFTQQWEIKKHGYFKWLTAFRKKKNTLSFGMLQFCLEAKGKLSDSLCNKTKWGKKKLSR